MNAPKAGFKDLEEPTDGISTPPRQSRTEKKPYKFDSLKEGMPMQPKTSQGATKQKEGVMISPVKKRHNFLSAAGDVSGAMRRNTLGGRNPYAPAGLNEERQNNERSATGVEGGRSNNQGPRYPASGHKRRSEGILAKDTNVIDFENIGDRELWQETYALRHDDSKQPPQQQRHSVPPAT